MLLWSNRAWLVWPQQRSPRDGLALDVGVLVDPNTTKQLDKDGAIAMDLFKELGSLNPSCEWCHRPPPNGEI